MARRTVLLALIAVIALLSGPRALCGTVAVTFSMPQGVDPPFVKFLNTHSVVTDGTELAPTAGVELHGRALTLNSGPAGCQLIYRDITAIQITFAYAGNVKVVTTVATGFSSFVPWAAQAAFDKTTGLWTVLLTAQPGSAPLSDWDVTGGALAQGFFAALTASSGSGAAPISNVVITPVSTTLNGIQKPSTGVNDVTPPTISASVTPAIIWSPNGKPVNVTLSATLIDPVQTLSDYISGVDPCSASVNVVQVDGTVVTQLGPAPFTLVSNGDGTFSLTAQLSLNCTRNGFNVAGRIYYITVSATDNVGNASSTTVTVTVAHDQSGP